MVMKTNKLRKLIPVISITLILILVAIYPKTETKYEKKYVVIEVFPYEKPIFEAENIPFEEPITKDTLNEKYEESFDLPKGILKAIHAKETTNDCSVSSTAGALGCFQLMPTTERYIENKFNIKIDPFDYSSSIEGASYYLSYLKDKLEKYYPDLSEEVQWSLVLASYNAGPSRGLKWARIAHKRKLKDYHQIVKIIPSNPFMETKNYVNTIMNQLIQQK